MCTVSLVQKRKLPMTGKIILMCQIYVDGEVIKTIETEY